MLRMPRVARTLAVVSLALAGGLFGAMDARAQGWGPGPYGPYGPYPGRPIGGRVIDPGRPGGLVYIDPGRPGGRLIPGYAPGWPGGPIYTQPHHGGYYPGGPWSRPRPWGGPPHGGPYPGGGPWIR